VLAGTEPLVLGLQVVDPSLKGLAVGTPDRFQRGIIRSSRTCTCAGGKGGMVQLELGALIKYAGVMCTPPGKGRVPVAPCRNRTPSWAARTAVPRIPRGLIRASFFKYPVLQD
jgi:hypothetical protein